MPFKHKTTKKISYNKKNAVTLDNKHMEFLNEFSKDDEYIIPNLKCERVKLREVLATNLSIEQRIETEERIHEITQNIKECKSKKKEYFLDNSKYIFGYFENKKNISTGSITNKSQILNSFFKIKDEESKTIEFVMIFQLDLFCFMKKTANMRSIPFLRNKKSTLHNDDIYCKDTNLDFVSFLI